MSKPKAAGPDDLPIMQDDRIHWNGQPVAIVLAETQEQADHAQSLIRVAYEEQNPVISLAAAKAKGSEPGVFMGEPLKLKVGDAEAALAAAPHKVDVTYTTPRHHHAPIELHACTLAWEGDTLRIHDASQAVAHEAWTIAQVFGLKEEQVRLTSPFVGGGFGSKLLWQHQILAAAAAKLAGRPVRIMLSREGVFRIVGGRTLTEQRVALGAQAGWDARRPDPHGRGRHDAAQQHARALHPAGEKRLRVEDLLPGRRDGADEHGRQHLHARARRSGRHVRPRIRDGRARRRTRAWIRSICASATSPRRTR